GRCCGSRSPCSRSSDCRSRSSPSSRSSSSARCGAAGWSRVPGGSASALALAARLRALDDDELTRLVAARGIRDTGIRDFFDLAEALLDRGSVQAALERLDRPTLAVLATAGELAESGGPPTAEQVAQHLGLPVSEVANRLEIVVDAGLAASEAGRFVPWDAVVEQLRAWPAFGLPSTAQLVDVPPPPALEFVSEADARFVD